MPITYYTEEEFQRLVRHKDSLTEQVDVLESLRPVWAHGFTPEGRAEQSACNALSGVWTLLGVTNQTECVQAIQRLLQIAEKAP